jgi:hypothetical protein
MSARGELSRRHSVPSQSPTVLIRQPFFPLIEGRNYLFPEDPAAVPADSTPQMELHEGLQVSRSAEESRIARHSSEHVGSGVMHLSPNQLPPDG